jgi:type II secretory pathway component PulF
MALRVLVDDPAFANGWPPPLRAALRAHLAGAPLGSALLNAGVVDDGPAAIVDAGEHGGFVPLALRLAADNIAADRARRRRALLAVAYPAFLVAAGGVIGPLPLIFSDSFNAYLKAALPTELVLGAVLSVVFIVVPRLPRATRQQLTALLSMVPFIGTTVVEDARAACLAVLGALIDAGASLTTALPAAVRAAGLPSSPAGRFHLARAEQALKRGATLAEALTAGGFVDDACAGRVAIAERAGTLDRTLPLLAKEAGEIASRRFTALAAAFGLLCFLAAAASIGVTAVGGMTSYVNAIDAASTE